MGSWGAQLASPFTRWRLGPGSRAASQQPVTSLGKAPSCSSSGISLLLPEERWKGGIYQEETTNIQSTAEAQRTGCAWLQDLAGDKGQGAVIGMAWWAGQGSVPPRRVVAWHVAATPPCPHTYARLGKGQARGLGELRWDLWELSRGQETRLGCRPGRAGGGLAQERVVVGSESKGLGGSWANKCRGWGTGSSVSRFPTEGPGGRCATC